MKDVMGMHALIAAEFHMTVSQDEPIYHLQYMAGAAEKRRSERIKAAEAGKQYLG